MKQVESIADASRMHRLGPGAAGEAAKRWLSRSGTVAQIISLALVIAVFALGTQGKNLSAANVQVVLSLAAIPAILAVGLHLTIVIGGIDLSVQGTVAICAVVVGMLSRSKDIFGNLSTNDVGLWILPISIGIGGACGLVSGMLHTKLKIPSFIATLGMSWVLYGLAVYFNRSMVIRLLDNRTQDFINDKPLGVANIVLVALGIAIIVQFFEDRTRAGRHLYAIGGDEALAHQLGVKVDRIKILAFTIAGLLYGLGAVLYVTRMGSVSSRAGLNLLFPVITAVAVGGVSLTGGLGGATNAILGTLILTFLNNGMILMAVNPYAQAAVNGVVLIVAVAVTLDRKKLGFIK
jgi:ribose transport system permease protein